MNKEVKSCPFCGGEADTTYTEFGDDSTKCYRVECKNSHALDHWEEDIGAAIEIWNKRFTKWDKQ